MTKFIGKNIYQAWKKYNSIYIGGNLVNCINSIVNKYIGIYIPILKIFGGIYVILKHAIILLEEGWDVDLIIPK